MRRIFLMSLRRGTVCSGLKAEARQVTHHSRREPSASVIGSLCRPPCLSRPGRCQYARSMSDFRDSARTFTPDNSCDLDEEAVGAKSRPLYEARGRMPSERRKDSRIESVSIMNYCSQVGGSRRFTVADRRVVRQSILCGERAGDQWLSLWGMSER